MKSLKNNNKCLQHKPFKVNSQLYKIVCSLDKLCEIWGKTTDAENF